MASPSNPPPNLPVGVAITDLPAAAPPRYFGGTAQPGKYSERDEKDGRPVVFMTEECPICLKPFEPENHAQPNYFMVLISCRHVIHVECYSDIVERVLRDRSRAGFTCPLCRDPNAFDGKGSGAAVGMSVRVQRGPPVPAPARSMLDELD